MCNCNQKREAYTSARSTVSDASLGMIQVKSIQIEAVTIAGDITGRVYHFSKKNDINWVDKRDLPYMTETEGLIVLY